MIRMEAWWVTYKGKQLNVVVNIAYPGPKLLPTTTAADRTEMDVLTIMDSKDNFIYNGLDEPHPLVPVDLMNAIIADSFLNDPQTVFQMFCIPEDDHIGGDYEIIFFKDDPDKLPYENDDNDSDSYDEDDDDDDLPPNRLS